MIPVYRQHDSIHRKPKTLNKETIETNKQFDKLAEHKINSLSMHK